MHDLDLDTTVAQLNSIVEFELAGVVRYTHYALMVSGPNRLPIAQFLKTQASESLRRAQQAGELLTGLEGRPSLKIAPIEETVNHAIKDILAESLHHQRQTIKLYKALLEVVKDRSIYLEEYARTTIGQEEMHSLELRKMLRDYSLESRS